MARQWRGLAISTADQALLSATNLAIACLFIGVATKEEYGRYTLVNGLVMLTGGLQAALVTTPLTATGARLEEGKRRELVATVYWLQCALGVLAALALAIGVGLQGGVNAAGVLFAAAAAVAALGAWLREYQRNAQFLDGKPGHVLAADALYAALLAAAFFAMRSSDRFSVTAPSVLLAVGVAALVPSLASLPQALPGLFGGRRGARLERWGGAARMLGTHGRWTLPGMAVAWGQNTGYSYLVALMVGSGGVAEVAASRLSIMPVNMLVTAWGRIFMPRAGALLARGDGAGVIALCRRSVRGLLTVALLHFVFVSAFFALGGGSHLPERYRGLAPLVAAWAGYAFASTARGVASTALYSFSAFRESFVYGAITAVSSLALMAVFLRLAGVAGAVHALTAGELILGTLCWRALKRHAASVHPAQSTEPKGLAV